MSGSDASGDANMQGESLSVNVEDLMAFVQSQPGPSGHQSVVKTFMVSSTNSVSCCEDAEMISAAITSFLEAHPNLSWLRVCRTRNHNILTNYVCCDVWKKCRELAQSHPGVVFEWEAWDTFTCTAPQDPEEAWKLQKAIVESQISDLVDSFEKNSEALESMEDQPVNWVGMFAGFKGDGADMTHAYSMSVENTVVTYGYHLRFA